MYYRGYVIDDNVSYNEKCQKYIRIGFYKVIQVKSDFVGVYEGEHLITHAKSWKRATKIAKLLLDAYCDGYDDAAIYY